MGRDMGFPINQGVVAARISGMGEFRKHPSEIPEGALAGENVPNENQIEEVKESEVEEVVNAMKNHPEMEHLTEEEMERKARGMLRGIGEE